MGADGTDCEPGSINTVHFHALRKGAYSAFSHVIVSVLADE